MKIISLLESSFDKKKTLYLILKNLPKIQKYS